MTEPKETAGSTGLQTCPGCGAALEREQGLAHPYMAGSVACWKGYAELLGVQYGDPRRMRFHQLVVDAYAAQHPGNDDSRAVQSVGIHLMTLALFIEYDIPPALGTRLHRRMVKRPMFHRLDPALVERDSWLTFQHVPLTGPPELAAVRAFEWALSTWRAWSPHHTTVNGWLAMAGLLDAASSARGS